MNMLGAPKYTVNTFRVELPDGNYALVLEAEEGGAEAEMKYVEVIKDT
jgi:hypothetical protein